ncbi:MAG: (2Fe-2S) ferredoxin domain-containing protein [Spirochaetales bacterium]|nr:(2Fe-2S) ferredoxin domain-containing protein [Spirochaetales bacterium]
MAKLTLDDLRKLREEKRQALEIRETDNKTIQVIVGMGTSGIAAGAKRTLNQFMTCIEQYNLTSVSLRQTGSIGLDHAEPVVEVKMPGMPDIIYGRVDPEVAKLIVERHILGKELVNDHVFDRPAPDIVEG